MSEQNNKKALRRTVALLSGVGILHFLPKSAPQFDELIPKALPGKPRTWVYGSGVAELLTALFLAIPKTRKKAAYAAAALFVAVFPGNITMAYRWRHKSWWEQAIAYGRLPLQIPMITRALKIAKAAK
ncbi:MAG: hypothetical protein Q3962_04525 [Corynebacterium sp.]|nr:hypothetical protein [Corynebacterium sp.]